MGHKAIGEGCLLGRPGLCTEFMLCLGTRRKGKRRFISLGQCNYLVFFHNSLIGWLFNAFWYVQE